jgi:hypothetical protein
MRRRRRATGADGEPAEEGAPAADRSPEYAEQVDEIERDRLAERTLVWQSLLAMLFVVALVVAGRLLAP